MRETNQIANYALVEWGDNAAISDAPPFEYAKEMAKRFSKSELRDMYRSHALPDGWEDMQYDVFLEKRRDIIARVIREAYMRLQGVTTSTAPQVDKLALSELVSEGETTRIEFKSTLRRNLHTGEVDSRMELAVLKTIAGFLNGHGGTLVVGVADDGAALGLGADGFPNEDKMHLHLLNLIKARMGTTHMMYVHPHFEDYEGARVLRVDCWKAGSPVFLKDGKVEHFFVRTGAATSELGMAEVQQYIKDRF